MPTTDTVRISVTPLVEELITFYYTEDELRKRGVSEDDLSPACFSTTTNSWTKVESYSVDKGANRLTVQIDHFSVWAMNSTGEGEGGGYQIFLPLVMKHWRGTGVRRSSLTREQQGPWVTLRYPGLEGDLTNSRFGI